MLSIVLLVDMGHRGLVYVEYRIGVLTWIESIFSLVFLGQLLELRTTQLVLRIFLVHILVHVHPYERHPLLSLLHRLIAVLGLIVQCVSIGLKLSLVTVHCHHQGIDWRNGQLLVVEVRCQLFFLIEQYATVLACSLQGCDKNLRLSLNPSFLWNYFFCHNIISVNGEKYIVELLAYSTNLLTFLVLLVLLRNIPNFSLIGFRK